VILPHEKRHDPTEDVYTQPTEAVEDVLVTEPA
jgi:hypothetical protein